MVLGHTGSVPEMARMIFGTYTMAIHPIQPTQAYYTNQEKKVVTLDT